MATETERLNQRSAEEVARQAKIREEVRARVAAQLHFARALSLESSLDEGELMSVSYEWFTRTTRTPEETVEALNVFIKCIEEREPLAMAMIGEWGKVAEAYRPLTEAVAIETEKRVKALEIELYEVPGLSALVKKDDLQSIYESSALFEPLEHYRKVHQAARLSFIQWRQKFFPFPEKIEAEKESKESPNLLTDMGLENKIEGYEGSSNNDHATALFPRSSALIPILCFTGDNVHRATIAALSCPDKWQGGESYFKEFAQEMANLKITIGLPNGEKAASVWDFIRRGGAAMVKAHYALWARYYEQVDDGFEMQDVVVNINDFCRDLGYAKATNGGYKPNAKRRAVQLLEALTTAEMSATYQVQGTRKGHTKTRRLKGTIWRRGLEAEEKDTYEDLLGNARAGDPQNWVPSGFSFSPGAWYADKEWRRQNKYVGKIGAGLMQLRVDRDGWAILIGGYLGTLARTGQYRNRRLKIGTILENTGLDKTIGHRQAQFREKFYRALDRLVEEKIIAGYKTEGFDDSDVDPEDLNALAEYGSRNPFPEGDWRGHIVEFEFDFAADMHRLETRKTKAIAAKTKCAAKKTESKEPTHAV